MNFFARLNASFQRFMSGRYGSDSLNQFLIYLWLFEAVLNLVFHSAVLALVGFVLCIVVFYRMFSKNIVKRQKENAAYYRYSQKVKKSLNHIHVRFRDRKIARFFRCPHCGAPIRMPRKIGKFDINCPKCKNTFQKEFKKF